MYRLIRLLGYAMVGLGLIVALRANAAVFQWKDLDSWYVDRIAGLLDRYDPSPDSELGSELDQAVLGYLRAYRGQVENQFHPTIVDAIFMLIGCVLIVVGHRGRGFEQSPGGDVETTHAPQG